MQKSQGYTLTSCRIPFLGSLIIVIMFCTIPLFSQQNDSWQVNARDRSLDLGWKFKLGDYYYGAEYTRYDDSDWRVLDLPHDWSIEDLTDQHPDSAIGPFSRQSPGGMSTGHVVGGTAWYRKAFVLDEQDSGQSVYLRFDGVYMESEVWINGHWCGYHPNGYMPYYYNITPHLNAAGDTNVVSVRVQNIGDNSRWYSGSGIYRHVWLAVVSAVHVDVWGVYVTTPEVTTKSATVLLDLDINNHTERDTEVHVETNLLDPSGKKVASAQQAIQLNTGAKQNFRQTLTIREPELWSPAKPILYYAETVIVRNGQVLDRYIVPFGIRTIAFSSHQGFLLNGEPLLLKGACVHHDNGILGAAAFDRAEERKVAIMKANGYNTLRTSHNPPSKSFLDACDRLGMLVIDEAFDTWELSKRPQGVHRFFKHWWRAELTAMLRRDRNHPSVIMWSIGNEIRERASPAGIETAKQLIEQVRELDMTRPVTNAISGFWDNTGMQWDTTAAAFALLDIGGYNYQWRQYETDHLTFPKRIMVGTESFPKEALENWRMVKRHSYVIGDFVWTGMDYLGESGLGFSAYAPPDSHFLPFTRPWPWFNAWCGDIDLIGNKKPQSYYRDVVWGNSLLEFAVHSPVPKGMVEKVDYWGWPDEIQSWNWQVEEGSLLDVALYTSCPQIRLELNGDLIGEQTVALDTTITAKFKVPFKAGILTAIGYRNGRQVVEKHLATTGPAFAVQLVADRLRIKADRNDLAYINVEVVDEQGRIVPDARVPVQFEISGEGEILAAGNARPDEMTSFRQPRCKTFRGRSLVIVRPTMTPGQITVSATTSGLQSDTIIFTTE